MLQAPSAPLHNDTVCDTQHLSISKNASFTCLYNEEFNSFRLKEDVWTSDPTLCASQREGTCCFYTDVDAHANIEFCLICRINAERTFKRKALSAETLGEMCLVRVNPWERLFPLLCNSQSLGLWQRCMSMSCCCETGEEPYGSDARGSPHMGVSQASMKEWFGSSGSFTLHLHCSTQPVKRLITDLKP